MKTLVKDYNQFCHWVPKMGQLYLTKLLNLITSNYDSILYYNCEIWLIPSLRQDLKRQLLAASSTALTLCGKHDWTISYERLHKLHKRATPVEVMKYKHALELYKLYNSEKQSEDWIDLKTQQAFKDRVQTIKVFDNSRLNFFNFHISFKTFYAFCKTI